MTMKVSFFNLTIMLAILSSCSLFDKKDPPLPGKRMNVLHYDLLKEENLIKIAISLPKQETVTNWNISDIGQFTGLPTNIKLAKELKLTQELSPGSLKNASHMIVSDILYSYSNSILSAYSISAKKTLWSEQTVTGDERNDIIDGSMAYKDGVIYLASGGRDLIALNAENGIELWRFKSPNVVRHIAFVHHDKQIYITSTDNKLSCLNLDGKLLWRYDAASYSLASSRLYVPSLAYEDKIVTTTTAGDLIILNHRDGEELTEVNLATSAIIGDGSLAKGPIASPVLDQHNLYILTGESDLLKIDLQNPAILWRQHFSGAKSFWIAKELTFLLTDDNQLLALENKNGKMIWIIDLPKNPKEKELIDFYGPILAGDQLLLTAANGEFFLFSPYDGKLIASYKNKFSVNQMPMIVNDKVYFISKQGNIAIWQ